MEFSSSNPVGLDGMEFIEFASPHPRELEKLFRQFGFEKIGRHKKKPVTLFRQNQVNFILNEDPSSFAMEFAKKHGPCIAATGIRVQIPAAKAQNQAISRGAKALGGGESSGHSFPGVYGIGESAVYFIDEYSESNLNCLYEKDFDFIESGVESDPKKLSDTKARLLSIDHLTNNVPRGEMQKWCDFYQKIFAFREIRYFDIKGEKTGLISKVMRSPCGKITIPINEPTDNKSQIQEYLEEYHGSGIQHLAMLTNDIIGSVTWLRKMAIEFLDVPDTYYEMLMDRLPNVTEDVSTLQNLRVLADGDEEGYLLQMFTQNLVGPIFFEIIQRKNHFGFGEGNFQALFDAIERDQKRRGYLN